MREQLENILWPKTVDEVKKQAKKLKVKTSGIKMNIIENIINFYCQENWVVSNYEAMSIEEKEFMDNIIRQKFNPTRESVDEIYEKYPNLDITRISYYYIEEYHYAYIPECFKKELEKLVPPYEISFRIIDQDIDINKSYGYIIGGEKQFDYINSFIKFLNQNKIKPTEKNRLLPKASFVKFVEEVSLKEIIREFGNTYKNIRTVTDTVITYGITSLLNTAFITTTSGDYYEFFTYYYENYIEKNKIEQAKILLEKYLKCHTYDINEIERITEKSYKLKYVSELYKPRSFILEAIKKLPINKWITGGEFVKNIRMSDYNFLRQCTGIVLREYNRHFNSWWQECGFYEFEDRFIDVCLMEYFAVLGLVDVVVDFDYDRYDDSSYLYVKFLRLTEFGAMVLDIIPSNIKEDEASLIVNEDFQIIVLNSNKKMQYELYFDRFFNKTIVDDKLVYDIDFEGFVKAYDLEIDAFDILNYIRKGCLDIPSDVLLKIYDYCEMQDKIKIKTVKVIEFPDEFKDLIDSNKKIKKMCDKSLDNILVIDSKKISDVKKELEKQKLFCKVEE